MFLDTWTTQEYLFTCLFICVFVYTKTIKLAYVATM